MTSSSFLAAQAEREAAERRLTAEQKRAIPDVTAIVGVRRLDYENATALTAGVSIPLNIFDRNRGNIAASPAEAQAAAASLDMASNDAIAEARAAGAPIRAGQSGVAAAGASKNISTATNRLAPNKHREDKQEV